MEEKKRISGREIFRRKWNKLKSFVWKRFQLVFEKFSLFSFEERGRAWETKGQHICSANVSHKWLPASLAVWGQHIRSANVSHKWLPASLAVWGFPNGIRRRNLLPTRTNREFQGIYADGYSAPRRKRGRHRRLCKAKCLTPVYSSVPSSKAWMEWAFDDLRNPPRKRGIISAAYLLREYSPLHRHQS